MSCVHHHAFGRREFLRAGALGVAGLSLADYLRMSAAGEVRAAKAQRAIFVYLGGGPTHIDSFDMKPDAAAEIRGEFKPIATNVSGISISEHLPKLAKSTDKYCIVRGVSHTLAGHELGTRYINTGSRPVPSLHYPGFGAVVTRELGGPGDLPPFVAIPNTPQKAGFLGVQYAPLETTESPKFGEPFAVRGIALAEGATVEEIQDRRALLTRLDTTFKPLEGSNLIGGLDRFATQAHEIIRSPRAREAFDTSRESSSVAEQYGQGKFGQSCMLAVRLIEAGVRFATVSFSGWDTHSGNFKASKESLLPQLDQGLSAMLASLDARGLLDSTIVMVAGEFGRTPKINERAGRDHWPRAMFVLLAGGGVRGGQVVGSSDDQGMGPAGEAITPDQIAASFYRALGIDHRKEYHTNTGRPVMIVRDGVVLPALFG